MPHDPQTLQIIDFANRWKQEVIKYRSHTFTPTEKELDDTYSLICQASAKINIQVPNYVAKTLFPHLVKKNALLPLSCNLGVMGNLKLHSWLKDYMNLVLKEQEDLSNYLRNPQHRPFLVETFLCGDFLSSPNISKKKYYHILSQLIASTSFTQLLSVVSSPSLNPDLWLNLEFFESSPGTIESIFEKPNTLKNMFFLFDKYSSFPDIMLDYLSKKVNSSLASSLTSELVVNFLQCINLLPQDARESVLKRISLDQNLMNYFKSTSAPAIKSYSPNQLQKICFFNFQENVKYTLGIKSDLLNQSLKSILTSAHLRDVLLEPIGFSSNFLKLKMPVSQVLQQEGKHSINATLKQIEDPSCYPYIISSVMNILTNYLKSNPIDTSAMKAQIEDSIDVFCVLSTKEIESLFSSLRSNPIYQPKSEEQQVVKSMRDFLLLQLSLTNKELSEQSYTTSIKKRKI